MQNFFKYGFIVCFFACLLFVGIIYHNDKDTSLTHSRNSFLEAQNSTLQNNIDNLQEDIDTLKKQSKSIVYITKIKQGKRDSIFVTIDNTNYTDIDSCNHAVKQLFNVCNLDKEIFKLKDSTITTKDSIIYKLEVQKGKYSQMVDNKEEVNEHLQQELKSERIRKKGATFLFTAMAVLNAYLIIKK